MKLPLSISIAVGVAMFAAVPSASAQNGHWSWGPPGWSAGFDTRHVENALIDVGLADPNRNYFTPGLPGGASSVYTGVTDTGYRNTFAINHDINTHGGIPGVGYVDVFTPLIGTNELAIAATFSSIWDGIVNTVSTVWDFVTGLFSDKYYELSEFGGYSNPVFDFDNSFEFTFEGYDWFGGGGGGGGGNDCGFEVNCLPY